MTATAPLPGAPARPGAGLHLFLPCAAGVEEMLAAEVRGLAPAVAGSVAVGRGGVRVQGEWELVLRLNLWLRTAQRVLIELGAFPYRSEDDIYAAARHIAWEDWFTPRETFRVGVSAHASPLRSLQFAALRVKDAIADRFRAQAEGVRPSVDTRNPQVRVHLHLEPERAVLSIDTSGEPLFKRGWRRDKGEAPLKETLAAAMLAASGWWQPAERRVQALPLYDPCCGSGTIVIEAAQLALGLPAGGQRRFAFEHLRSFDAALWARVRAEASETAATRAPAEPVRVFGSDVAHRMVDFAARNAERAGVAQALALRGGDALQREPPSATPGVLILNPPYGERIDVAGVAAHARRGGRERFVNHRMATPGTLSRADGMDAADRFFQGLAAHWKTAYGGWTAWILSPDPHLPAQLRLKESRRVPLWNGPIECRLLRFDLRARRPRDGASA